MIPMALIKSRKFVAIFTVSMLMAGGVFFAIFDGWTPRTIPPPPARVPAQNGAADIALDPFIQAQNGIRVEMLPVVEYQPRREAYGIVLDMQPLLELRLRIIAARESLERARDHESASAQEYKRLVRLSGKDGSVSRKAVEEEKAVWKSDKASRTGARDTLDRLREMARIEWGSVLGEWVSYGKSGDLSALMEGREVLLLVTILPEGVPGTPPSRIFVQAGDSRTEEVARLVSDAPGTDTSVQGRTYFYRMPSKNARIGMRLSVGIPSPGGAVRGVFLPDSAIIWYLGRPWTYMEVSSGHFQRKELEGWIRVRKKWFSTGFGSRAKVVVEGAQLILSRELQPEFRGSSGRSGPSDENDDDDD